MFFAFYLDRPRLVCRRAPRDVLAKLGYVEDIVDILESPPEIQPVGCLLYTFHHPKRSHKPSPKLPSTCQVKCLRREQHFFSHVMFLQSVVLVEVTLLVLWGSLEMILGSLDKLLDMLYKVSSSRHPTLVSHNSINK